MGNKNEKQLIDYNCDFEVILPSKRSDKCVLLLLTQFREVMRNIMCLYNIIVIPISTESVEQHLHHIKSELRIKSKNLVIICDDNYLHSLIGCIGSFDGLLILYDTFIEITDFRAEEVSSLLSYRDMRWVSSSQIRNLKCYVYLLYKEEDNDDFVGYYIKKFDKLLSKKFMSPRSITSVDDLKEVMMESVSNYLKLNNS